MGRSIVMGVIESRVSGGLGVRWSADEESGRGMNE